MRSKIHEATKEYCFIEVEIEEADEATLIASTLRVLGEIR